MKKFLIFMAMAIVACLMSNAHAETIQPISIDQSECKDKAPQTRAENDSDPFTAALSYQDGILTLSVYDFQTHCCPEFKIVANTDTEGEIHFIISDKSYWICDCICRLDIECTYEGILSGHYDVYLEEEGYKQPLLQKSIDIEDGCNVWLGKPAGLESEVSSANGALSLSHDHVVTVDMQGETKMEIFDADGRLMSVMTLQAPGEVSLTTLPEGLYLLRATNAETTATLRIIR